MPVAIPLLQLPLEVLFQIFQHCDVNSLGLLALCSKSVRDRVSNYLTWGHAIERLSMEGMSYKECTSHCRKLGVLMKRITVLFSTKERLKIMLGFIEKFVSRPSLVRSRLPRDMVELVCAWRRYGAFLMAAICGWVDNECQVVHEFVGGLCYAQRLTSKVLGARPGSLRREELALRHFVHSVYLGEANQEDVAGWLHRLLQPWPLVFRAKMLFIIYGPCCPHELLWEMPSLPVPAASSPVLHSALQQMGYALLSLYEYGAGWTSDDTISVIEELFGLYREWRAKNCAELLIHCGKDICVALLTSKLINGREAQVATIIFNMILVEHHHTMTSTLIPEVVHALAEATGSVNFLRLLPQLTASLFFEARAYYAGEEIAGDLQIHRSVMWFCASMLRMACDAGFGGHFCSQQ